MRIVALIFFSIVLLNRSFEGDTAPDLNEINRISAECRVLIPHLSNVKWYEITGGNFEQITRQMQRKGPQDFSGKRRYALTEWYVNWRWDSTEEGVPKYQSTTTKLDLNVVLPKLVVSENAEQGLTTRWNEYLNNMIRHECVHVANAINAKAEIDRAVMEIAARAEKIDYKEANKQLYKIVTDFLRKDINYDYETQNGTKDMVKG